MAMQGWWKQLKRIGLALLLWQTALGLSWAQNIGWFGAQQTHTVRTDAVTARLLAWAPQGVAEGQMLWLGLHMQHAPGWHTYWKNPGQADLGRQARPGQAQRHGGACAEPELAEEPGRKTRRR